MPGVEAAAADSNSDSILYSYRYLLRRCCYLAIVGDQFEIGIVFSPKSEKSEKLLIMD